MRAYNIQYPNGDPITLQLIGKVVRFRNLPTGTFFLQGEDVEHVFRKVSPLVRSQVYPWTGEEVDMNNNPWCEPMEMPKEPVGA